MPWFGMDIGGTLTKLVREQTTGHLKIIPEIAITMTIHRFTLNLMTQSLMWTKKQKCCAIYVDISPKIRRMERRAIETFIFK